MRRSVRLPCRVRRMDDWRLLGDRAVDLSPQGLLLLSDERVDEGLELVVSFQATELPIWFDTRGTGPGVAVKPNVTLDVKFVAKE